ncbi:MAG: hypothetical protein HRS51_02880 [Candidatus Nitrosopelagicus sp.]|nr:hypothetical protein [Candidatus Nitrosopelagicus sp.]
MSIVTIVVKRDSGKDKQGIQKFSIREKEYYSNGIKTGDFERFVNHLNVFPLISAEVVGVMDNKRKSTPKDIKKYQGIIDDMLNPKPVLTPEQKQIAELERKLEEVLKSKTI